MNRRKMAKLALACVGLLMGAQAVQAAQGESWPARPIRMLVGFAAGGPTDYTARVVADGLGKELGQTVVVENKAGANGQTAAIELLRSQADGYTIMLASSGTLSVSPARYKELPFDIEKDFAFVGPVSGYPYILVTPASFKADSLQQLVDMEKASPGALNAAAVSHTQELTLALFNKKFGIQVPGIPYKGDSASVNDLVGERLDFAFISPNVALPLLEGGKLKGLATTDKMAGALAGKYEVIDGFNIQAWNGLVAPAGTPDIAVQKLGQALQKVLSSTKLQDALATSGQSVMKMSPEEFKKFSLDEAALWKEVAQDAGLELL
nr:tripartite tricarboxylate transporter substrate binding protein [Pseudomonas sp.]